MKHVLDLLEFSPTDIATLLDDAARMKLAEPGGLRSQALAGRVMALIFEKPSLRTRVSFETAMAHLGGYTIFQPGQDVGLGARESVADVARTISQFVDVAVLRTYSHQTIVDFAANADCVVLNALSDYAHPCQALGDLLTLRETFGTVTGKCLVFVGDGNNVSRSLAIACGKMGVRFILSSPEGYGFDADFLAKYRQHVSPTVPQHIIDPNQAVKQADVIYTDVWTSMGQEAERDTRLKAFARYQVNAAMLGHAPKTAKVMHCLPAHRGEEISAEVLDGPASIVFLQAGNRMHLQKALLHMLLAKRETGKGASVKKKKA